MNMFLHELRSYRKSTIIWTVVLCGIAMMYLSIYPSFAKDITAFKKVIEGYPEVARKALGFSVESFNTVLGFYSVIFSYILLCGSIQAMNIGTSIVSKEIREKTADFLLTKPVNRIEILTAKISAALVSLLASNIVYILVATSIARVVNTQSFSIQVFLMISFTMFFVQLFFMSLGIIISVMAKKIKSVIAISLSTVFGFFIASMFGSVIGEDKIRYITPFKFYDASYIVKHASYEATFIILEIIFIVASIGLSYVIYKKKDIHAV